jgi:glycerol-1-phosphatase
VTSTGARPAASPPGPLLSGSSGARLVDAYDGVLLDLDGVVYVGPHAVPGAPETISAIRHGNAKLGFVTNNAARTPEQVASALRQLGVEATATDVVTAAQAAARLLADEVPAGAPVLVVGGDGLRAALEEFGLVPVTTVDDDPVAVIQGWSPDLAWPLLAEGCVAVARDLPWVASNTDLTIPTPRGLAPGSGAFVNAIAGATRRRPVVAGKPEPPLLQHATERLGAAHPLLVGDRLDTDIAGAVRVGMDSLLVLSGVTEPIDLLKADATCRPTHVAGDLRGLLAPAPPVSLEPARAECNGWVVSFNARIEIAGEGAPLDGLRALCCAAWSVGDRREMSAGELEAALERLGLSTSSIDQPKTASR